MSTTDNTTDTDTEAALAELYGDLAPQHDSLEAIEAMVLDMAEADELRTRLIECRRINAMLLSECRRLDAIVKALAARHTE
jgi:Mg2+ and Co2+ transporter CorA